MAPVDAATPNAAQYAALSYSLKSSEPRSSASNVRKCSRISASEAAGRALGADAQGSGCFVPVGVPAGTPHLCGGHVQRVYVRRVLSLADGAESELQ
eukprot:1268337-Prymnesium_polylepis.1